MPNVGEGSNWNDPRQVEADAELERLEKIEEHNARLAQARGFEVSGGNRLADRIRRMLGRSAPVAPAEPQMSEQEIWARELERRKEFEQQRKDGDG